MSLLDAPPHAAPLSAFAVPGVLALGGVVRPASAGIVTLVAGGLSLSTAVFAAMARGAPAAASPGVLVDTVTCVMLVLVGGLLAIIARYSATYLAGDPGLGRYQRWLLLTASTVTTLIIADNLLVVALAWTATSLSLHQLLTFFADRPAALVAAHKKFLVSRLADLCLFGCLPLVYREVGSLDLAAIAAWARAQPGLTPGMHVAAAAIVVAVALKSAQLPFHGWLTQVMEAPTPVSALLHAGIVNIGGFVLLRLAPWMAQAELARLLLLTVGLVSAVVAALVMTTRISVKVALAWSTCAQMGFLLVQCGLGLWHLALLHLVAHSLYKAHAFLAAGTRVDEWRIHALRRPPKASAWLRTAVGICAAIATTMLCFAVLRHFHAASSTDARVAPLFAVFVGVSMLPLLAHETTAATAMVQTAVRVIVIALFYGGGHAIATRLTPEQSASSNVGWLLVVVGFVTLFGLKTTLQTSPEGALARALYPWLYAGLYLDERFTRLTFRVWPPRLPQVATAPLALPPQETFEADT